MMKKPLYSLLLSAGVSLAAMDAAVAESVAAGPMTESAIAIYNDGISVVGEKRTASLIEGGSVLLSDLPDALDAGSLLVDIAGKPAYSLTLHQDTLSQDSLLQRSIGKEIVWLVPAGDGAEREIRGTLMGIVGGILIKTGGRYEILPPNGRLALDRLPDGMAGGLEILAETDAPSGTQPVAVRYLTAGLGWSADYTAELLPDGSGLTLSGHYLLDNRTGTNFRNAAIRLVAGDTTRMMKGGGPQEMAVRTLNAMPMADSAAVAPPQEATLGDVHVYDLGARIDLPSNRQIRRSLIDPVTVPVEKLYRLTGNGLVRPGQNMGLVDGLRPAVSLKIDNAEDGPLGKALPAGIVRVFGGLAADDDASPDVLLGEDSLQHLPVGGEAVLSLGRAFDVTATRRVTDYEITGTAPNRWQAPYRVTHEIVLKNGREEPVTLDLTESLGGAEWSLVDASHKVASKDAGGLTWKIDIPARGETTLTYTAKVQP